jgi:hypothetical protein
MKIGLQFQSKEGSNSVAWMIINENVVNLEEVVLLTQHIGPVSGVPGHPSRSTAPWVVTVHVRGGASFVLHGELGIEFKKYFLEHVAKDAVTWKHGPARAGGEPSDPGR